jgi:hypothetical protein
VTKILAYGLMSTMSSTQMVRQEAVRVRARSLQGHERNVRRAPGPDRSDGRGALR